MSFPAYDEYSDSGFEWFGELPDHWPITRLRYVADCLDGQRIPLNSAERADRQGDVPYWGANCVVDYVDEALFDEALVLLGEDGAPFFDSTKPVAFFTQGPIWPNNHVHVLRPKEPCRGRFLVEALNATDYANFIDGSTRDKLTQGQMGNIPLPWPPLDEQEAISSFLDVETSKIDALVTEQRRLIELLKEKRQAVISHAVTKGLNPNAPMKPSGIQWLGDVPQHWNVGRIKYECQYESGHTPSKSKEEFWVENDCHIPWVSLNDTKTIDSADFIDDTATKISEVGMANSSAHLIDAGAVVFTRDGARVGLSAITTKPMCVSQHVIAWVCGPNVSNHFLLHVIYAMNAEIYRITAGSTIPTIGMPDVKRMNMPLPPVDEQLAIVEFLVNERERFATLIADAKRAIELLQERRTALISAAVTGKIDVRESAYQETA